jgi:PST family polysaccharide transporter
MIENSSVAKLPSVKISGGIVVTGQIAKAFIQLSSVIFLSRLLTPEEVGIVAMATVFLFVGEFVRDFGISQAALQTENLTNGQASNLFWGNAVIGFFLTIGLYFSAPLIANMYGEPILSKIVPWIGLSFTINALESQFQVRLARQRRFKELTISDISSQIIGVTAAVMTALYGYGCWALVIQILCINGSRLLQRIFWAKWTPKLPSREPGMKAIYRFGFYTGLAQLVQLAASNLDTYTIGTRLGAGPLGVYNRGFQLFSAPALQFLVPLTNVALPVLSEERRENGNFYPLLFKAQVVLTAGLTYILMLLASMAEPLVRVLLGPSWHESASITSILSIGGAAQSLSFITYWAFLSSGKSKQLLVNSLITKSLLAICIVIGLIGGIRGVASGFSAGLVLTWVISLKSLQRCDKMPIAKFLYAGSHTLLSGLIAGVLGWLIVSNDTLGNSPALVSAIGSVVATSVYIALLSLSPSVRQILIDITRTVVMRARMKISS